MHLTESDIARFWSKVDKRGADECWPWLAGKAGNGYGSFGVAGKVYNTHAVALFISIGEYAPLYALHSCDNRACVNPNHLRAGTQKENIKEMDDRGRRVNRYVGQTVGSKHGMSKLTEDKVRAMKALYRSGVHTKTIAGMFSVSAGASFMACTGRSWKHVV